MHALTFFFDYAEVLCRAPSAAEEMGLAQATGLETSAFLDRYWEHRTDYDIGGSAAVFWSRVTGVDMSAPGRADQLNRLVKEDIAAWTHFDQESIDVVAGLESQSIQVVLLSNLPTELAAAVRSSPMGSLFDRTFFSSDVALAKPDPAFFRYALRTCSVPAQSAVFVDDRAANLVSAAAVGMHAVPFEGAYRLTEQVSRWLSHRPLRSTPAGSVVSTQLD